VTTVWSRRASTLDLALGGVLTALMVGELVNEHAIGSSVGPPVAVGALLCLVGLAVAARNVAPFAALVVNSVGVVAVVALGFHGFIYRWTNLINLYTAGERSRPPLSYIALAIGEAGVAAWFWLSEEPAEPLVQVFVMLLWVPAWLAGIQAAARRRELARERAYVAESAARQAAETRATIAEERAQMARELHDALGHSVTLMVMQAGAARRSIDRDPTVAVAAMEVVEQTGRAALRELDRLLGLLHRDREAGEAGEIVEEPAPGLEDLGTLAERTMSSSLQVELAVDADTDAVPRTVQHGVFRVIQEALTNTLKHANADHVRIDVHVDDDCLVASVYDDGRGTVGGSEPSDGRGLIGLAARIDVLGGTFAHGPQPGGGYRVACEIPLS
jgi:signal transduction histidine kinase